MAVIASENYRTTPGAVTDVSPDVQVGVAGWTNENNTVDGSPVGDARLYGAVYRDNGGAPQATRTITLPAAGIYTIRVALGFSGGAQNYQYLRVLDNATQVLLIDKPAGSANQAWFDANGTAKDQATWTSTYATSGVNCTFATTTLVIVLGTPSAQAPSSTLAHFSVESTAGAAAVIAGTAALALDGTGTLTVAARLTGTAALTLDGTADFPVPVVLTGSAALTLDGAAFLTGGTPVVTPGASISTGLRGPYSSRGRRFGS